MRDVLIISACRTAIGKLGGTLADIPAPRLGAHVIGEAATRGGIQPGAIHSAYMGCVLTAALGQNPARQAAVYAGMPAESPAFTINCVCGSGLQSVLLAAREIQAGAAGCVVAGGMESMSGAAFALTNARFGYRMGDGKLVDTLLRDALTDAFDGVHMGVTAENIARKYNISRERQDAFAACSQQKCESAQDAGIYNNEEIAPMELQLKKQTLLFDRDEYPRRGVTAASLARLSPAFLPEGTVTAGNASGINDGAAAVLLMDETTARARGAKPLARIVAGATAGCDPQFMGLGPVYAVRKALAQSGLALDDIGLFELNEAFAAQSLAVMDLLSIPPEITNVNGGAIALGHPVGASGCRILVTLLHEMRRRGTRYGLCALCVGGGMGVALIVECC